MHNKTPLIARIIKNTGFVFLSRIFDILVALFATALIARYLGLVEFGYYAFVMAISIFLAPLVDLGFERITAREISRNKELRGSLLGTAMIARGVFSLVIMVGVLTAVAVFDWNEKISIALIISMLDQIFIALGMLSIATFQAFERMEYQFGLKFIFNAVFLVLIVCVIQYDMGFLALFFARLAANIVQTLIMLVITVKRFIIPDFTIKPGLLKFIFREALPLGLFTILLTASFKVDVFVLKYFRGLEDISLFEAAHRIIIQLQLLPMSLIIAMFPHFSRKAKDSTAKLSQSYKKTFKFILIISLPFPVFLSLLSEPIISLLFGVNFIPAAKALAILSWSISFLFLITLHSFVMTSEGRQIMNTISAGACLLLNLILDIALVPKYGFIGASYGTLISYGFFFLVSLYFTSRTLGLPDLKRILPKPILAAAIVYFLLAAFFHGDQYRLILFEGILTVSLYGMLLFGLKVFDDKERAVIREILHLQPKNRDKRLGYGK